MKRNLRYYIKGGDFVNAGTFSSEIKKVLQKQNIDARKIKRIVIALYEAEVNVVAHAYKGAIDVEIDSEKISVVVKDKGPGIENIRQAMEDGYSTASKEVKEMGFGAGLGLSNMKRNSDKLIITSKPGEWTKVEMVNYFNW
ncbi:MAG: anti-sigma regulatory factor [Prolixibacteraceae bacterium]|nr:anti-sigma regulatory factor [Prolixibacteraceae bacterium]